MGYDTDEKEPDTSSSMSKITIQPYLFGRDRIPNKSPKISDYNEWKYAYINHLSNMYSIIDTEYDEYKFEAFCKMVYSKSSKYISPYL